MPNWWEYQIITGGRISSRLEDLDKTSQVHPWIPNAKAVRPKPEEKSEKERQIAEILKTWKSLKDYIFYKIFKTPVTEKDGIKEAVSETIVDEWTFQPSLFKYELPSYANHYILWNSKHDFQYDFVDEIITNKIKTYLGEGEFDFAWYKNPKPSVVDFYHVQVFWVHKKDLEMAGRV